MNILHVFQYSIVIDVSSLIFIQNTKVFKTKICYLKKVTIYNYLQFEAIKN